MKPKTKAFVDKIIEDPKISATNAYLQTHETTSRDTARANASLLLSKPAVHAYLASKTDIAEKSLYQVLKTASKHKDSVHWMRLFKDSANDLLDRVDGKPVSRTNNINLNVNVEQAINELI